MPYTGSVPASRQPQQAATQQTCEAELTRALLFTVLSNFLENRGLLPY